MSTRKTVLCGLLAVILALAFVACKTEINPPETVPGSTLEEKLQWLQANAQSNTAYAIDVSADEAIAPHGLSYSGKNNIVIIMKGTGSEQTVSLSGNGSLFTVDSGVTLVLDRNITLRGRDDNNDSLVRVNYGGALEMKAGAKISGNTNHGVYVGGGIFTMHGGEISGNSTSSYSRDGVVSVGNGGIFTMNGGEISGNTNSGVIVEIGIFTMNGGEISGNTNRGVYVEIGIFTMNGGEISGNTGGGAAMFIGTTFTMNGGTISGNTASEYGGGVVVLGTFDKTGGTISGYADNTANGNVVKDKDSGAILSDRGHAVCAIYSYGSSIIKRKETTAGPGVNLSLNGNVYPATFSGAWDY